MNSDPSGYFTLGDLSVSSAISTVLNKAASVSFAMAIWSGFISGLVGVGDQLSTGNYDPDDLFSAFIDGALCGFAFGLVAQFIPIKILMALSGLGVVGGFAGAIQSFSDGEFWQGIYRTSLSALGGVGFWKAFGSQVKGYVSNLTSGKNANINTSFSSCEKNNKIYEFSSEKKLLKHYNKHVIEQKEFGNISMDQYLKKGIDFFKAPQPYEKIASNGDILKYSPVTNEFIIVTNQGTIRTYYKLNPINHEFNTNIEYWNSYKCNY